MSDARRTPNPNLILPVGTQVAAMVEVRGTDGKPVHPRGAVGVVIAAPADDRAALHDLLVRLRMKSWT